MERTLLLQALAFGLGIFVQIALIFHGRLQGKDRLLLAVCLASFVFGFIPGKNETEYRLLPHTLAGYCVVIMMCTFFFKNILLPVLNEEMLLIINLLFLSTLAAKGWLTIPAIIIVAIPTLMVLAICLWPKKLSSPIKATFAVWYLLMILTIGIAQFRLMFLDIFSGRAFPQAYLPELFMSGMAFFWLMVQGLYVMLLLPIPGKHQPLHERIKQIREQLALMAERFGDDQVTANNTLMIFAGLGAILLANYERHWISPGLLTNMVVVGTPFAKLAFDGFRGRLPKESMHMGQP